MILDIMAISLTQGLYTLVDGEDYERLNQHKWYARKTPYTYYAIRHKGQGIIYMHREILNAPAHLETNHRNHNGLDNRKTNLRVCTRAQNTQNARPREVTSKFKGIGWYKSRSKWRAKIFCNGKHYHIGYFFDEDIAAKAYDKKAKELFGEFAITNF